MKKENDSIHFSETPLQIYNFFGEQLNIMVYDKYDSLSSSMVRPRTFYGSQMVFLIKDHNFFHEFSKIENTVFKNVNFGVLHVDEGGYLKNVLFENCNINKIIFDTKPKNVTFKNCKIFDVINKTESDKLDITLDGTIISDENIEKILGVENEPTNFIPDFYIKPFSDVFEIGCETWDADKIEKMFEADTFVVTYTNNFMIPLTGEEIIKSIDLKFKRKSKRWIKLFTKWVAKYYESQINLEKEYSI